MKKLLFISLCLLLIILLCGCNNPNETEKDTKNSESKKTNEKQITETVETLDIGQTADYSFGTFTISGFKRDGDKLYYSVLIDPKNDGDNRIELDNLKYYFDNLSNRLPQETVELNGNQFQNVYTLASKKVAEIDAISLKYNDVEAKWKLNLDANDSGDVSYIDDTVAQNLAQSNQQNLQQQQQQAEQQGTQAGQQMVLVDEQQVVSTIQQPEDINQAWSVLNQYGKETYPDGFELNYTTNKMTEEKRSDGTWLLKAGCTLTSMEGDKIDATCQAIVEYYEGNWDVLSFEVY